jgi:hypothetical protein
VTAVDRGGGPRSGGGLVALLVMVALAPVVALAWGRSWSGPLGVEPLAVAGALKPLGGGPHGRPGGSSGEFSKGILS